MAYKKISGFSDKIHESIDVQFAVLNKLGIRWFEPRGINGVNIAHLSDEERADLLGKMKQYDIHASSIGSPIGKASIDEDFASYFTYFKRVVDTAKFLAIYSLTLVRYICFANSI